MIFEESLVKYLNEECKITKSRACPAGMRKSKEVNVTGKEYVKERSVKKRGQKNFEFWGRDQ